MKRTASFSLLILSALISFSQPASQETINLSDSLNAIDITDILYMQISRLELEKLSYSDCCYSKKNAEEEYRILEEFFIRQDLYRELFDKLESGIKPKKLNLEFRIYEDGVIWDNKLYQCAEWQLFEISKSKDGFPIIIYYDAVYYANGSYESSWMEYPYLTHGGYPLNDFGLRFFDGDPLLKKRYPKINAMMKEGKISFINRQLTPCFTRKMEAPKFYFPADWYKPVVKTTEGKQRLADDLLSWISIDASSVVSSNNLKGDLIPAYLKLERENYSEATLDDKILLRRKFIEFLYKTYPNLWE